MGGEDTDVVGLSRFELVQRAVQPVALDDRGLGEKAVVEVGAR